MREHASLRAPTIALIEPDDNLALILEYNIEAAGFRAHRIDSHSLAVEAIGASRPTAIILNRSLTAVSGIEIARKIRVAPGIRPIPIIMLADRRFDYDQSRAIEAGIAEWGLLDDLSGCLDGRMVA